MTILIGTNNRHKAEEMAAILQSSISDQVRILRPEEIPSFPVDIAETGTTLEENAYIKAAEIFEATGIPCIADDTGLEVDALGGRPGVYSARYAGDNADFASNRALLLDELQSTHGSSRTARFRTVVCYRDSMRTLFAEGVCEGVITTEEQGDLGFGYDAIFRPTGSDRTFAEMDPEEKNSISHRSRALAGFAAVLAAYGTPENSTPAAEVRENPEP